MADERSLRRRHDGMARDDLRAAAEVLAESEQVGIELRRPGESGDPAC